MINCPNCGTPNEPQFKFCIKCGNVLNSINQPQSIETNQTINNTQPNISNIEVNNNNILNNIPNNNKF